MRQELLEEAEDELAAGVEEDQHVGDQLEEVHYGFPIYPNN